MNFDEDIIMRIFYEVYIIAPKVCTIVVGLLHRQFCDACTLQQGMRMQSLLVSETVFRVGAYVRKFVELQKRYIG